MLEFEVHDKDFLIEEKIIENTNIIGLNELIELQEKEVLLNTKLHYSTFIHY